MSHFVVLVVGPKPEQQLAPYQENNMGDCPEEYLAFNENDECEVDKKTGKKGYWENPNAKWDWHVLGGRWTGFFKMKADTIARLGRPGVPAVMAGDTEVDEGRGDQAMKKDIDFYGMRIEAADAARVKYLKMQDLFGGEIPKLDLHWRELFEGQYKNLDHNERRGVYGKQPAIKALERAKQDYRDKHKGMKDEHEFVFVNLEDYQISIEQYVQRARDGACCTFALLKNGKWYECGQMGWWGCVSNEKDDGVWEREFAKLIDEIPSNTLLSVYDCHI